MVEVKRVRVSSLYAVSVVKQGALNQMAYLPGLHSSVIFLPFLRITNFHNLYRHHFVIMLCVIVETGTGRVSVNVRVLVCSVDAEEGGRACNGICYCVVCVRYAQSEHNVICGDILTVCASVKICIML